jgi:hypothetical protein
MTRPLDVFVGLYRLVLVVFALVGTRQIYLDSEFTDLSYFTNLTGIAVAIVFGWAGIALLLRGTQPPAWLKGAVTLFAAVTGLIAYFVLAPEAADAPRVFLGLTDGQIEHQLLPVAVVVDFLLCDAHRRLKLRYAAYWIVAMLVYLIVTLIRGAIDPSAGYPYGFIDVAAHGYGGVTVNVLMYGAGIYVLGVILWGIDRVLPTGPIIGSGAGSGARARAGGSPTGRTTRS